MRTKFQKNIWIILIILLAFVLRFYQLAINPPHLTPDEAALGYNAFSILKTGRDEYGQLLPIIFKSFGDFKPGLYVYATVPFVGVFGLNEFSVRAASALAGVIAVWLVYKIVGEFRGFGDLKRKNSLAILSTFLLAISPWHIHFSRGAWEINLSLTLTLAGIYFFLLAFEKPKNLIWSAILFALTLTAYQGSKMSTLVVLMALTIAYFGRVKTLMFEQRKTVLMSLVLGIIIALPIFLSFFRGQTGRLAIFSVWSQRRPVEYLTEQLDQAQVELGSPGYYLYYSEVLTIGRGVAGRWFNHVSPRFLFFDGDWTNPRHSAPDHGMLLLADAAFLLIGLFALVKWRGRGAIFVLLWLILAPLPSALSRDQVHAVRAYNMVVPVTIVIAAGLTLVVEKLRRLGVMGRLGMLGVLGLYVVSFAYFLDSYLVHQPKHNSQYWEYGYKQAVRKVIEVQDKYETVHVRQSFAQPYIYFLFFQQYDPSKYQVQANLIESEYGDVGRVEHIDNIDFLPIDWTRNRGDFNTLFVADPIRIPPEDSSDEREFVVEDEIWYLDGKEISLRLVGVKERKPEDESLNLNIEIRNK